MAVHVETRRLSRAQAEEVLRKHHVGRLAVAFHDRVTIELVNYAYADGSIYGRLEDDPELTALRHHHWIAFEVSEVDGIYDWRSVSARGSLELLHDGVQVAEATEFRTALEHLRAVVPAIFTAQDPIPARVHLFRIFVDELVGRAAKSWPAGRWPPTPR